MFKRRAIEGFIILIAIEGIYTDAFKNGENFFYTIVGFCSFASLLIFFVETSNKAKSSYTSPLRYISYSAILLGLLVNCFMVGEHSKNGSTPWLQILIGFILVAIGIALLVFTRNDPKTKTEAKRIKEDGKRKKTVRKATAGIREVDAIDGMEGHDFEFFCADLLEKNGFINVKVTRGSGDQGVDVLAEKEGKKYAVQCKNYSSPLSNTPVQEVHAGMVYYGCQVGVVMTNNYFTVGAIDLAEATGILLWDREMLQELMDKANNNG